MSKEDNILSFLAMAQKWLFQPLNKITITQRFGENRSCIDLKTGKKTITCDGHNPPKGWKSVYSRMKGHNGLDLHAKRYTPIYAPQDGVVTEYVAEDERGLGVGIQTTRKHFCKETGKKEYFKIRLWHNYVNLVKIGEKVKIGQPVALVDNTGYSSGDHLHLEIKPVDKEGNNLLQSNGYFGAVDPQQYLNGIKASDFTKFKTWQERLAFSLLVLWRT